MIKKDDYSILVHNIERVREKNNTLWCDILRIALKKAPSETRKIMAEIRKNDETISQLFGRIADGH